MSNDDLLIKKLTDKVRALESKLASSSNVLTDQAIYIGRVGDDLRGEIHRLKALNAELVEFIEDEVIGTDIVYCPMCSGDWEGNSFVMEYVHEPTCKLADLLKRARAEKSNTTEET